MVARTFDITFNQLLNLARTMELRPVIDALRARWVSIDPASADTVIGTVTTSVGDRGEVSIVFDGKPVHAELVTAPEALRLTVDPPTPRLEQPSAKDVRAFGREPEPAPVIGWACYEIIAGSPEAAAFEKRLDPTVQRSTEEADALRYGHGWQKHGENGYTSIPVLQFLVGQPWDARALNMLQAVRPSSVLVLGKNAVVPGNCVTWRVTVMLEDDNRTIAAVAQEVDVGLRGWRYGSDASAYIEGREPQPGSSGAVINPRAIEKLKKLEHHD